MRIPKPWFTRAVLVIAVLAMGAGAPAARASTFTVVYTFPTSNPIAPQIGAVRNGVIYGVDPAAGGNGVLFTLSPTGVDAYVYAPLYTFSGTDGAAPNPRLILDGTGGVLGTTQGGGTYGAGTIFRISAQGRLLWSHSLVPGSEGASPLDGLAADAIGNFYGTAYLGAKAPGDGTLFHVTANGQFRVLHMFQSQSDGHCPASGVVVNRSGTIYGTTVGGGFGGQPTGSLWARAGIGKPTTFYTFADGNDGEYPQVTPSFDGAGNLWGVTSFQNGQSVNTGAIWEYTSTGMRVAYDFLGGADGGGPNAPLLLGLDGNFYGTTTYGGDLIGWSGHGVVFKINPGGGNPTVVHTFTNGADGATPIGNLALDISGQIYGGTQSGMVFRITP